MKHSDIALAATHAAVEATGTQETLSDTKWRAFFELYAYARARGFPPPETLARKLASIEGKPFGFASIADLSEPAQAAFAVFGAVARALEPFHEPDLEQSVEEKADGQPGGNNDASLAAVDGDNGQADGKGQLSAAAKDSAGPETGPEKPADAKAAGQMPGATANAGDAADAAPNRAEAQKQDATDVKTEAAQGETDRAIAKSGGRFSDDAPKKKTSK